MSIPTAWAEHLGHVIHTITAMRAGEPHVVPPVAVVTHGEATQAEKTRAFGLAALVTGADGLRWECSCGASIWAPFRGEPRVERPS